MTNGIVYREKGKVKISRVEASALILKSLVVPTLVTFAPAAGASNICEVTLNFQDGRGNNILQPVVFDWWLSDAATGAGLTTTTASGAVAAKASNGVDFAVLTAKKATRSQALATGAFIASITDTAKTHFYLCVQLPCGNVYVSPQLLTANYG